VFHVARKKNLAPIPPHPPISRDGRGGRCFADDGEAPNRDPIVPAAALAAQPPPTTNPTLAPRGASSRARRAPIWRLHTTPRARPPQGRDIGRRRRAVGRQERRRRARRRARLPPSPLFAGRARHRLARLSRRKARIPKRVAGRLDTESEGAASARARPRLLGPIIEVAADSRVQHATIRRRASLESHGGCG